MTVLTSPREKSVRLSLPKAPFAFWVMVSLFVMFSLTVERFATIGNLVNVTRLAAILCVVSCGQAIVLILGGIEFSFGSAVALASVTTVLSLPYYGVYAAFAVGAATVLVIGTINAVLISRFEVPPFIATLGMLLAAHGLAEVLVGGLPLDAPASAAFSWPARGAVFGVPVPIIAALLALIVLGFVLERTLLGRTWYLVGGNAEAARLAGIPVGRVLFVGYLSAAAFCAVAAVILTSRIASGHANLWPSLPFETIAACAIGGIPLAGGQGRASQVLYGVCIIAMMQNAVILLNFPAAYQQAMIAIIIVGSVLGSTLRDRLRPLFNRKFGDTEKDGQ